MSPVVATINGRPLLTEELRIRAGIPAYAESPQDNLRQVLDQLIDREILAGVAERQGFADDPDVIEAGRNAAIAKLTDEVVRKVEQTPVTDEELQARYDSRFEQFYRPVQVEVASATFPTQEQALTFVRSARRRISASRFDYRGLFQRTAAAHDGKTRQPAWVISLDDGGTLPKPHSDAIFALPDVGALTMPLLADGGWVVFQRTGRRDKRLTPFREARPRLIHDIRRQRRSSALDKLVTEGAARLKVERFDDLLDKVVISVTPPTNANGAQGQRSIQPDVMRRAPTSPNTVSSSRSSSSGTISGASASPSSPSSQDPPTR